MRDVIQLKCEDSLVYVWWNYFRCHVVYSAMCHCMQIRHLCDVCVCVLLSYRRIASKNTKKYPPTLTDTHKIRCSPPLEEITHAQSTAVLVSCSHTHGGRDREEMYVLYDETRPASSHSTRSHIYYVLIFGVSLFMYRTRTQPLAQPDRTSIYNCISVTLL